MSRTTSGDPASIVGPSQPSPPASVAAQETASAESSHDYQAKHRAGGRALSSLMQPIRGRILVARIIVIASCVVALAPYLALVKLGTILLSAHIDHEALVHTANLLVAAFCTQALLYVLAVVITHFADLKLRSVLQGRIIGRLSRAPLAWFSSSSTGQVRKAIQDDTVQVHALVAHAPVEQTAAIGIPVVLLVYAFVVDWRLGLLCLATFPIYALLQWWSMRGMTAKTAEMDDKLADISANAIELTEGVHVVKNFGQTGKAHRRFTTACEEFARFYWDWCGPLIKASALSQSVISVPALMAINLGFGLLMARAGWVGVADVLTCSLIALVLPRTVEVLGSTAWMYQQAGGAALRLQEVLSIEQIDEPGTSSAIPEDTTVTFDDISVSYHTPDGEVPALNHVSLTLRPGTVTALVGPSGSGKSTLATMLARFRDPDFGTVRIGGVDLRELSPTDLYRLVSFVLQDPYLQRQSIRDVITLARPDATEEQVRNAARTARILDDIDALPAGFDTVLGEDTNLSGGQKQRLSIARAVLADAPILVLDEATAATDPDCEAEIQQALAALARGRTVLVIGHHAESVIGADVICVMENGSIAACGTAEQLAEQPYWARLSAGRIMEGVTR